MISQRAAIVMFCLVVLHLTTSGTIILFGGSDTPAPSWSSYGDMCPAPEWSLYCNQDLSPAPMWSFYHYQDLSPAPMRSLYCYKDVIPAPVKSCSDKSLLFLKVSDRWSAIDLTYWLHHFRVIVWNHILKYYYQMYFRCLIHISKHLYFWMPDVPPHLLTLDFYMTFCCYSMFRSVAHRCRILKMLLLRGIMRRHDFLMRYDRLRFSPCNIFLMLMFSLRLHTRLSSDFKVSFDTKDIEDSNMSHFVGGGRIPTFTLKELLPHMNCGTEHNLDSSFKFISHSHHRVAEALYKENPDCLFGYIDLKDFVPKLTMKDIKSIAKIHSIHVPAKTCLPDVPLLLRGHHCSSCDTHVSVFKLHVVKTAAERSKTWYSQLDIEQKDEKIKKASAANKRDHTKQQRIKHQKINRKQKKIYVTDFPPLPPSVGLKETIINGWCNDAAPNNFMEGGCAVCGQLVPLKDMSDLSEVNCDLNILNREGMGITRLERFSSSESIEEIKGPVLDTSCDKICHQCHDSLADGLTPVYALANGLWLGAVPTQLQNLTFAEQLLIARVRHNKCIVRVSSGMSKMKSNAIMFENPTPKIYSCLPPSIEDLDEVLAFIFTGPTRPSPEDLERTPLLVRRRRVAAALEWLKLNHADYHDLDISYENLDKYPENGPPVVVVYRSADTNKEPEATSAFDNEDEDGVEDGPCPFVVNGVTGEELEINSPKALVARAARHLKEENGKVLAIGHAEKPQSTYHNPQLYPMMFPCLFPYGLGGIGSVDRDVLVMGDMMHKRKLLMYHDKRFQRDSYFPLVAFNHEQIKKGTTGGYLLTERNNFQDIADRLMNIDTAVLEDLSKRLSRGDRIKPESPEEKACYELISDLDHVAGHVQGSITSKKYMRNEIWSLISYIGAPSWFITFAPADCRHPICLYFADTKEKFSPELRTGKESYNLIAKNPVAGARFFDFMVRMFIQHVLGVDTDHPGLYGDTSAYYGTVEQQGRLTLHLHLLLWISGSLTPQELRDKIMDPNSDFQKKMVEYLESLCVGQFLTGSKSEVSHKISETSGHPEYKNPTFTLPESPSDFCSEVDRVAWWKSFDNTVDDLLLKSNLHTHKIDKNGDDKSYCLNAKGECKRRFPRDTFEQTLVDPKTGALNLKKGEPWMNTVTPELTYLLRSNSDVTSLLSGTAIKAIVAYVTDYITKQSLKTYSIFDVVRSVFDRNSEMIGGDLNRKEKVRKIFTQVVNSLTAKTEIGGPMASLYILGNPDHYTSHVFIPFYWRSYVKDVWTAWGDEQSSDHNTEMQNVSDKVVINKSKGEFIGLSKVNDYKFRPEMYSDVSLYDWIRLSTKKPKRRTKLKKVNDAVDDPEFYESDDELNIMSSSKEQHPLDLECGPGQHHHSLEADPDTLEDDLEDVDLVDFDEKAVDDEEEQELDELDVISGPTEQEHKTDYSFQQMHPQHQTHQARVQKDDPTIVPNFIPNTLPRSDRGDREYYCCTMMTLFKPWRTGNDLKSELQSWDDSFTAYKFSKRQIEIMKYFNVRYECLDARDDYSAKRDKEDSDGICYQWATSDALDQLDDMHYSELANSGADFNANAYLDGDEEVFGSLGVKARNRRDAMLSAERIMKTAGWLDKCKDGLPDVGCLDPLKPSVNQPGKSWRAAVLAKRQEILDERIKHLPTKSGASKVKHRPNEVKLVDKTYIDHMFKPTAAADNDIIESSITKFNLNTEQKRAFHIIANHATMDHPEKLHMYLGGMGGTGKSQVIKALMHFFNERKENHRFIVLAPTGAAAALLNGSTYHSVLGINEKGTGSARSLAQIRAKLDGVDYIFLDEVSMLSCRDMYNVSSQCAKARGEHNEPFGGINFIFAGDFAQLPPAVSGFPLYSGTVGTQVDSGQRVDGQESAIGKALWHQVTTVVILRQNMRQDKQSPEDTNMRTALENMRYKACTSEDIVFLRTRIAGKGSDQPKLAQKRFRNVSIITARNAQKDRINELGCERFAAENNQTLTSFYSIDRWKNHDGDGKRSRGRPKKKLLDPVRDTNVFPPGLQKILWEQPHASSDKHVPGKLTLCIGMPVMLRHNDATECCITKGAEATVVSWQSSKGPEGQNVLDTLFVKLKNPPKTVKIDGLPENVVPITRHTTSTMCALPNDDTVFLSRDQVLVLPNFAMTDYASQGRTRPDNIVDLSSCRNHQSYYTCLSRSATADGTIIIQGFDPKQITGGASGYLRQEFRELEILDEITKLRYEGSLSDDINGHRRNTVIRQFQKWKGTAYVPKNVHSAIKWSKSVPLDMLPVVTDSPWQIIKAAKKYDAKSKSLKSNTQGYVAAKGTVSVVVDVESNSKKRKSEDVIQQRSKKMKVVHNIESECPTGITWDEDNYSCAYDALLTILFSLWSENPSKWKKRFHKTNRTLKLLASGFQKVHGKSMSLETARDKVRHILHQRDPVSFPNGNTGTCIQELIYQLFKTNDSLASSFMVCNDCDHEVELVNERTSNIIHCPIEFSGTTADYCHYIITHKTIGKCGKCKGEVDKVTRFHQIPSILAFSLNDKLTLSKKMKVNIEGSSVVFTLRGIIYFGGYHFTSRIMTSDGQIWFHDGILTGYRSQAIGKTSDFTNSELLECNGKDAIIALYAQT